MPATIHHLRACNCGKPGAPFEADWNGEIVAYGPLCVNCRALTDKLLRQARPVYETMLRQGFDREVARDAMIFLLNAADGTAALMGGAFGK